MTTITFNILGIFTVLAPFQLVGKNLCGLGNSRMTHPNCAGKGEGDWADEIAKQFDGFTAGRVELLASITTALRNAELRGRANGIREVSAMLGNSARESHGEAAQLLFGISKLIFHYAEPPASKLHPPE